MSKSGNAFRQNLVTDIVILTNRPKVENSKLLKISFMLIFLIENVSVSVSVAI